MKLFDQKGDTLSHVRSNAFALEKEIQDLVEGNVNELFGLDLVRSEFPIQSFRFDSLCFDAESNAFVIIEYKKGTNYSVIDQGYTYLSVLLNNKADFILEFNERMERTLKRDEVDWSQSRVIFVSPKFTAYQRHSIGFRNVPFELWEITRFENGSVSFNQIETQSDVDINSVSSGKSDVVRSVSSEVVKVDEAYHLNKSKNRPQHIIDLYHQIKERILAIGDDIEIKYNKQCISFRRYSPFADAVMYDKGIPLMINLRKGELNDPLDQCEDISEIGHWGNGDYRIYIQKPDQVEYAMSLVKQSYERQGG
jgi:predicted transport protein